MGSDSEELGNEPEPSGLYSRTDRCPLGGTFGVAGALALDLVGETTSVKEDESTLRLFLLFRTCMVGLSGCSTEPAWAPFHVDRLSGEKDETGLLEPGRECGRDVARFFGVREKEWCFGEGGAYISASWGNSEGAVTAEKRWRTLSH